jgi:hypothetical protein
LHVNVFEISVIVLPTGRGLAGHASSAFCARRDLVHVWREEQSLVSWTVERWAPADLYLKAGVNSSVCLDHDARLDPAHAHEDTLEWVVGASGRIQRKWSELRLVTAGDGQHALVVVVVGSAHGPLHAEVRDAPYEP